MVVKKKVFKGRLIKKGTGGDAPPAPRPSSGGRGEVTVTREEFEKIKERELQRRIAETTKKIEEKAREVKPSVSGKGRMVTVTRSDFKRVQEQALQERIAETTKKLEQRAKEVRPLVSGKGRMETVTRQEFERIKEEELHRRKTEITRRLEERERVEEIRIPSPPLTITAAPPLTPTEAEIRKARVSLQQIEKKRARGESLTVAEALEEVTAGQIVTIGLGILGLKAIVTRPGEVVKGLGILGKRFVAGETVGFRAGQIAKLQPGFAISALATEVFLAKGLGKVTQKVVRAGELGLTRISPKFKPIKTRPLGEQIIAGIPRAVGPSTFELGLIPKGAKPPLRVSPLGLAEEARIPLRPTPRLPALKDFQRRIINVAVERGDAISGSLAQKTLVKGSRTFEDVDSVAKNQRSTASAIKEEFGDAVIIKKVEITNSP